MKHLFWIFILIALASCSPENRNVQIESKGDFQAGILILNSGKTGESGSLDFASTGHLKVNNKVYDSINHESIGMHPTSLLTYGNHLYIVVSGENKIIKSNRNTLKKESERRDAASGDLIAPQNIVMADGNAYVTVAGNGSSNAAQVLVLDPNNLTTRHKISLSGKPGKIFAYKEKIYVLLKGDQLQQGNKVAIIDPKTNSVVKELSVGFDPNGFTGYKDKIVISCGGRRTNGINDEGGSLWLLNTNDEVQMVHKRGVGTEDIQDFLINIDDSAYFLVNGKLHSADFNGTIANEKTVSATIYSSVHRASDLILALRKGTDSVGFADVYLTSENLYTTLSVGMNPIFATY